MAKPEVDAGEHQYDARDAYRSALVMAVMMFVTPLTRMASMWRLNSPAFIGENLFLATIGVGTLAYLIGRRQRLESAPSLAICLAMTLPFVIFVPYWSVQWVGLGRPWEAFAVPMFLLVCIALVIPRFFWLGAALNVVIVLETCAGLYIQRRLGVPRALQPIGEPLVTIGFGCVGLALLWLRERRRRQVLHYLRAEGEVVAMQGALGRLQAVRRDFAAVLERLVVELERVAVHAPEDPTVKQMLRSTDRLAGTTQRLAELREPEPESPGTWSDAEQLLFARDAQRGAITLATVTFTGCLAFARVFTASPVGHFRLAMMLEAGLSLVALLELLRTRRRPRWARGTIIVVLLFLPWFFIAVFGATQGAHQPRPFPLFGGVKLMIACLPLMLSGNFWLGAILDTALCAEALVVYYALGLSALNDRISWWEPWQTLLFGALGIALLSLGEERRVASVRALRVEAKRAALLRRSRLFLALRDQVNSPLQTLVLSQSVLAARGVPSSELKDSVDQLVRLTRELPNESEAEKSGLVDVSIDGAAELRPRPS